MDDRKAWFAPKRYGLGSGLPIAWQGWVLLIAYVVVLSATAILLEGKGWLQAAIIVSATVTLLIICARTTRGGWRWRWGSSD